MSKKKLNYSCDFETTTDPDDCRVWAWGYMEIGNHKNFAYGTDINDFMAWVEKCQANLYFHNLRFDGEFIVNYLLHKGWRFSKEAEPQTFNAVISNMGQWYMLDLCFGYKGNKKIHTVIYDSYKKLPFTVKKIAKDFKLSVLKGEIDYNAYRPPGHQLTEEEKEYLIHDIQIVAEALDIQFKQGMVKMTNGSDALKGYKDIFGSKTFDKYFPSMSKEMYYELKPAYKGGFTWLNKRYAEKPIGEGMTFDVVSLYPSQMYYRELPYGKPMPFEGKYEEDKRYPLYIQHIKCSFQLKEGYIPTIQIKGDLRFKRNEYLESSEFMGIPEIVDLYLTNIDLALFLEHYETEDLVYVRGWKFRSNEGQFFKDYIDKWIYIKSTSDGAIKALAKLMLNSLYGKFATNPDVTGKQPYLVEETGATGFRLPKDEEGNTIREFKEPLYLPMGIFITSWARYTTISAAQKCFDRIIYCDTDSLHVEGLEEPEAIKDIIGNNLGNWAHENTFKEAYYIRQKTYAQKLYAKEIKDKDGSTIIVPCGKDEATTTKLSIKCAGMPEAVKEDVSFEEFRRGYTHPGFDKDGKPKGKLKPKHVKGGVVLVPEAFTIK